MNYLTSCVRFLALCVTSVVPLFAMAGVEPDINGAWSSNHNTTMHITNRLATVHTYSAQPMCLGSFKARVVQQGDQVILHGPVNSSVGGSKFEVHFLWYKGELHEIKPYPSGGIDSLGYWHGSACGFGLSEGGAVFKPTH